MNVLSHFGELDELIRVLYQGVDRFVVLSEVTESSWTVHVGLKGHRGRWWRGAWSAQDVSQFIGPTSSTHILAKLAHNLSDAFVNGEPCVGDWAPEEGAKINLTLGPVQIPLVELSAEEAASHATAILTAIALQAQSRRCRLNPSSFSLSAQTAGPSHTGSGASDRSQRRFGGEEAEALASLQVAHLPSPPKKARVSERPGLLRAEDDDSEAARRKIKSLEAELAHVKAAKKAKSPSSEAEPRPSVSARPKGASLANPHKKARKYQTVEFDDD